MFGNKLAEARAALTRLTALFAVVGYKPSSAEDATEEGFRTALAAHTKTASDEAVKAATAAATTELTGAKAELTALREGLKQAGIAFVFNGAQTAEESAAGVKAAIEAAISTRATASAVKTVVASGHDGALPQPTGSGTASASAEADAPATAEEFNARLKAISDPVKRTSYFRAHKKKFGL